MTSRPLEAAEYKQIINLLLNGFITENNTVFRPNKQAALALQLEASLGLRIGDVLALKVNNFRSGKLERVEDKTGKLQYRDINPFVYDYIKDYSIENQLNTDDKLFCIGVRTVQKHLKTIADYLKLDNISTHSFRKMYATFAYEDSGNNLELVKELLNHTSVATTQKYIRVLQQTINIASARVNFVEWHEKGDYS
ncbi:MAG: tyrosine-type recombinase/integrase [Oscillospiraceae bacterium]|jgi:integrase|nr:tyrosine-type recombinase/integrase [Oscillospiraceae bacterium]